MKEGKFHILVEKFVEKNSKLPREMFAFINVWNFVILDHVHLV